MKPRNSSNCLLVVCVAEKSANLVSGGLLDPAGELARGRRQVVNGLAHQRPKALFVAYQVGRERSAQLAVVVQRRDGQGHGGKRVLACRIDSAEKARASLELPEELRVLSQVLREGGNRYLIDVNAVAQLRNHGLRLLPNGGDGRLQAARCRFHGGPCFDLGGDGYLDAFPPLCDWSNEGRLRLFLRQLRGARIRRGESEMRARFGDVATADRQRYR